MEYGYHDCKLAHRTSCTFGPSFTVAKYLNSIVPKKAIHGTQKPSPGKCRKIPGNSVFPTELYRNANQQTDPGIATIVYHYHAIWGHLRANPSPMCMSNSFINDVATYVREEKQHKHKLFGPDFPWTFLTLTPGCPGVKKFLPTTGAAGKRIFWCGRPRFSVRTSMT